MHKRETETEKNGNSWKPHITHMPPTTAHIIPTQTEFHTNIMHVSKLVELRQAPIHEALGEAPIQEQHHVCQQPPSPTATCPKTGY